jgi:hypothetical protein
VICLNLDQFLSLANMRCFCTCLGLYCAIWPPGWTKGGDLDCTS